MAKEQGSQGGPMIFGARSAQTVMLLSAFVYFVPQTPEAIAQCLPTVDTAITDPYLDHGDTTRVEVTFDNPCDDHLQVGVVPWLQRPDNSVSALLSGNYILELAPGDSFVDVFNHSAVPGDANGSYRIGVRIIDRITAETLAVSMATFFLNVEVVDFSADVDMPLPDVSTSTSTIDIPAMGQVVTEQFNIDLEIVHTCIPDLRIELVSPRGMKVTLHARTGPAGSNIVGNYPHSLTPHESLDAFIGEPLEGTWTLTIQDLAGADVGRLVRWGLKDYGDAP